jgi:hypothetical protein
VDGAGGGCGRAAGQVGNELGFRGCGYLYTLPMRSQSSNQRWTAGNSWGRLEIVGPFGPTQALFHSCST